MPKAYGVNSTIASVDVCQTDKIFYRRTITFLKRCTICFNDCIVGLNWKRSLFFWRKQYTPPSKLSKYYSKAPLSANSRWPVSFYITIFKKFACFKSSDSQLLLFYLLIIHPFSVFLSIMPPVLFHISLEEKLCLFYLCLYNWVIKK